MHAIEETNRKLEGSPETEDRPTITSKTCKLVAAELPKIELPSHRVNRKIQFMKDHVLIGNFIGFWPTERLCMAGSQPNGSLKTM